MNPHVGRFLSLCCRHQGELRTEPPLGSASLSLPGEGEAQGGDRGTQGQAGETSLQCHLPTDHAATLQTYSLASGYPMLHSSA